MEEAPFCVKMDGALLIAVGWLTRSSAFIASGQMPVAYFMAHAPRGLWPLRNGGELAATGERTDGSKTCRMARA